MSKYQIKISCVLCRKETTTQALPTHLKQHTKQTKKCQCGAIHSKPGVFCSRSCANTRTQSQETKNKIRQSLLESNKTTGRVHPCKGKPNTKLKRTYTIVSQCVVCHKWYAGRNKTCGVGCLHIRLHEAGLHSANTIVKRSKDEVKLYTLCSAKYQNVSHNTNMFNGWDADILLHDHKIAILWNGPWHYREMNMTNHSLKQVQTRDKIKKKEIESSGWTLLIFEDRKYTPETAFIEINQHTNWLRGHGIEPVL